MVINVCLPQFKPRIHCNKISADGYEVENLISEDLARRNRGFRSEYFIKPPVHVTISFPFNIEICRINIDVSSGGYQTFSGLEVYTSTSCNKTSWQSPEGQFSGLASQPLSDKDTFTLVGKAVLKNQSKVTFGHRGFKPRPPFHQVENVLSYPGSASQDLWNKGPSSLSNVSHLRICITHVAGGGLPCIKRLEVWGQPAKSCPQEVIEGVFQVASQFFTQEVGHVKPELWTPMESDCVPFSANDSEQQTLRKLVDVVQDIPEEFLDPITLEIMTLPMLLPSGKVIDQTTLEKCNRSEASWGRVPSDPFTGVAFSQHSQPLPHPTLKARIDHFLLQHSIPGTNLLGRAHASEMLVPSSITMSSLKRKMDCMDPSSVQPPYFSSTNLLVTSTSENSAKKMKPDSDSHLIHMDCSTGTGAPQVPLCSLNALRAWGQVFKSRGSTTVPSHLFKALRPLCFAADRCHGSQVIISFTSPQHNLPCWMLFAPILFHLFSPLGSLFSLCYLCSLLPSPRVCSGHLVPLLVCVSSFLLLAFKPLSMWRQHFSHSVLV
ncbi:RING finger protein 37 isoform X1 [Pezoporus occidentalis]|uniref:RING finger protein 37 isoform X1 n=1 Tax=Pezoporus occidentalis TaxID=407982 RepID=UPI002F9080E7